MNEKNFVIIVMSTNEKKSLTFILPAWSSRSEVSVIVISLIALRQNMMNRCRNLKILCAEWHRNFDFSIAVCLMFVTFEFAVSEKFQTWVNRQRTTENLDRIFIDKCHIILNQQTNFRRKLQRLGVLNQAEAQIIMLTTTLSSSLKKKLWARMWWKKITIRLFRIRINRQNIQYYIIFIDDRIEKIAAWTKTIDDVINRYFIDEYVMYCNFSAIIEQLIDALNCEYFHSQVQNKAEIFNRFRNVDGSIIVAISAFEIRINVSDIRIVFHIDCFRNLLNYA